MDSSIKSCLIWASLGGFLVGFLALGESLLPCWSGVAPRAPADAMQVVEHSSTTPSANDGMRIQLEYGDASSGV